MRKKYYIILDTETCNSLEEPLPYDIGWVVCDRYGNIYEERSYIVNEIFFDLTDIMTSAYYSEKIPKYYEDIKSGNRVATSMWSIRRQLLDDMRKYKTKEVGAYNMAFDRRALNTLIRYVSKSWMRWFFPCGTKYFCIWNCACELLLSRKSYLDFAIKNGLVSEKNNILTNAECTYRYITKELDFKEEHTGLADCRIEAKIFAECIRQHKKMDTSINPYCWRKVQTARKKYPKYC